MRRPGNFGDLSDTWFGNFSGKKKNKPLKKKQNKPLRPTRTKKQMFAQNKKAAKKLAKDKKKAAKKLAKDKKACASKGGQMVLSSGGTSHCISPGAPHPGVARAVAPPPTGMCATPEIQAHAALEARCRNWWRIPSKPECTADGQQKTAMSRRAYGRCQGALNYCTSKKGKVLNIEAGESGMYNVTCRYSARPPTSGFVDPEVIAVFAARNGYGKAIKQKCATCSDWGDLGLRTVWSRDGLVPGQTSKKKTVRFLLVNGKWTNVDVPSSTSTLGAEEKSPIPILLTLLGAAALVAWMSGGN